MRNKNVITGLIILLLIISSGYYFWKNNSKNNLQKIATSPESNATIPPDFPNLPIYPGAKLITTTSDPSEGEEYIGIKYSTTWESTDSIPAISKWYIDELPKNGWTLDTPPVNKDAQDIQLATFYNDNYSLNMSFIKNANLNNTLITAEFSAKYRLGEPAEKVKK